MVLCGNDILTADRSFIIVRDYDIPPADVRSVTPSTAMRRVQRVGGMLLNASRHTCQRPTRLPPAAAFLLRSSAGPVRPIQARVGKYTVLADHTCPVSSSPKPRTLHIHYYSLLTTRSTTLVRQASAQLRDTGHIRHGRRGSTHIKASKFISHLPHYSAHPARVTLFSASLPVSRFSRRLLSDLGILLIPRRSCRLTLQTLRFHHPRACGQ